MSLQWLGVVRGFPKTGGSAASGLHQTSHAMSKWPNFLTPGEATRVQPRSASTCNVAGKPSENYTLVQAEAPCGACRCSFCPPGGSPHPVLTCPVSQGAQPLAASCRTAADRSQTSAGYWNRACSRRPGTVKRPASPLF